MEIESQKQIDAKKKEVEQELIELLSETKSDFTLDHVKDVIYNNDAWNYFPHKIIGGLSPAEKLLEYNNRKK